MNDQCPCVVDPPPAVRHIYATNPNFVNIDKGAYFAVRDCEKCFGTGAGQDAIREWGKLLLTATGAKFSGAVLHWDIKKTSVDPNVFATITVVDDSKLELSAPRTCTICHQPVKQGYCGCV